MLTRLESGMPYVQRGGFVTTLECIGDGFLKCPQSQFIYQREDDEAWRVFPNTKRISLCDIMRPHLKG